MATSGLPEKIRIGRSGLRALRVDANPTPLHRGIWRPSIARSGAGNEVARSRAFSASDVEDTSNPTSFKKKVNTFRNLSSSSTHSSRGEVNDLAGLPGFGILLHGLHP